ncbi:MAG TPA: HepT-like ribonuclease domain-containing protein [Reyranella sp.]|nr:HepT-like ribonuclease domain-containing protein [Reyranella sp.]
MADWPERDAALLLDMLLAARDARSFIKDLNEAAFLASRLHQNAVIRSLEVLGEAASKISADTKGRYLDIPWWEIVAMRHHLIHGFGRWRTSISFR